MPKAAASLSSSTNSASSASIVNYCSAARRPKLHTRRRRRARQWLHLLHRRGGFSAGARKAARSRHAARSHLDRNVRPRFTETLGTGLQLARGKGARHGRRRHRRDRYACRRRRALCRDRRPSWCTTTRSTKCSATSSPAPISSFSTRPTSPTTRLWQRPSAKWRARLRPAAKHLRARHGQIAPSILLGLSAAAEDDLASRPSFHDNAGEHDHDDFDSFVVALPTLADATALLTRLPNVIAAHDILRVKGFLDIAGKPFRQVVQAVGPRVAQYFDRPWHAGRAAPIAPRRHRPQGHRPRCNRGGTARNLMVARSQPPILSFPLKGGRNAPCSPSPLEGEGWGGGSTTSLFV